MVIAGSLFISLARILNTEKKRKIFKQIAPIVSQHQQNAFLEEQLVWTVTGESRSVLDSQNGDLDDPALIQVPLTLRFKISSGKDPSFRLVVRSDGHFLVSRVDADSKAHKAGLRQGQIVLVIDCKRLQHMSCERMAALVQACADGKTHTFVVRPPVDMTKTTKLPIRSPLSPLQIAVIPKPMVWSPITDSVYLNCSPRSHRTTFLLGKPKRNPTASETDAVDPEPLFASCIFF